MSTPDTSPPPQFAYGLIFAGPPKTPWIVALCERGVQGLRPLDEYGPFAEDAELAGRELVERLNRRIGVSEDDARMVIISTMPKQRKAAR